MSCHIKHIKMTLCGLVYASIHTKSISVMSLRVARLKQLQQRPLHLYMASLARHGEKVLHHTTKTKLIPPNVSSYTMSSRSLSCAGLLQAREQSLTLPVCAVAASGLPHLSAYHRPGFCIYERLNFVRY